MIRGFKKKDFLGSWKTLFFFWVVHERIVIIIYVYSGSRRPGCAVHENNKCIRILLWLLLLLLCAVVVVVGITICRWRRSAGARVAYIVITRFRPIIDKGDRGDDDGEKGQVQRGREEEDRRQSNVCLHAT